jgi:hypothetical protein
MDKFREYNNIMAHFAKIENDVVTQVIVADNQEWCETNLGGTWVQTSYNTKGNVNSRDGGVALHKNYAGVGYTFDGIGFAAPQPYPSWIKNSDTYLWEAPVPKPTSLGMWQWDEETQQWLD